MLTRARVVQIHPSKLCNYKCKHCYSESGPEAYDETPLDQLLGVTERLAKQGYRRASLSGGEPVIFREFERLTTRLTEQGFRVTLVTNGSRYEPLASSMRRGMVKHAAVSFDGPEEIHDHIRQRRGAFQRALKTLRDLADEGHSVGAVVAVCSQSLVHLPDLVEQIVECGATQIQLHPLAPIGRAKSDMDALVSPPSSEELIRLIMLSSVLSGIYPTTHIQCDAATGPMLQKQLKCQDGQEISPIVVRDDGWIVPYAYDMPVHYALGHVKGAPVRTVASEPLNRIVKKAIARAGAKPAATFYRELVTIAQEAGEKRR